MSDRMALFKAAKAQRSSSSAPTKEQIKALKAQKAKAAAEAAAAAKEEKERKQKHEAALSAARTAAAAQRQEHGANQRAGFGGGAMPPPAPRPRTSTGSAGNGSNGSTPGALAHRTDSQIVRIGRNASVAPEPAGQSNASSGAVPLTSEVLRPTKSDEKSITSLPVGFFDEPAHSEGGQESIGTGELIGSNADFGSEVASARGTSVEAMSAQTGVSAGGLPSDFFEAAASTDAGVGEPPMTQQQPDPDKPGALPTGFFENKEADAKARGVAPARKKTKEEEYEDFMASVASDVREVEAREQAEAVDAAQERADRESFEQRMRVERIERLKKRQPVLPDAKQIFQSEAEVPRVDAAALRKPAKRRRLEQIAEDASEEEGSGEDEDQLDWRAKGL